MERYDILVYGEGRRQIIQETDQMQDQECMISFNRPTDENLIFSLLLKIHIAY